MKKKVSIKLGDREYILTTDEDEETYLKVADKIKNEFRKYEKYIDEVGIEQILFVMLANLALENVKLSERIKKLSFKIVKNLEVEKEDESGTF
ncbi:MAG TPA: cell division protein ZapA [Thermotoga sp.]|nr:cell division protein ZapA [Thermotoga sp.]